MLDNPIPLLGITILVVLAGLLRHPAAAPGGDHPAHFFSLPQGAAADVRYPARCARSWHRLVGR